ncbi:hypothetical protein BU25DRAFT_88503 [Macroventuria anomochaeta]|uniref:Uncharacterized protein n=1 Tax=Macroventuria anomochaeta TaxID=301207 RepID=A0ACB6SFI9_9PLEO|nr:uncharacterized protein BU25DRAFT_88503 [Macroventuria anomochaeta]KAF2633075.1 hypothetical protein BU25DRAFT_88503 [Macroventuria anomochaeta]
MASLACLVLVRDKRPCHLRNATQDPSCYLPHGLQRHKRPNVQIAWKKLPDTLKLNDKEAPLRPLPDPLVHLLNKSISHKHLHLLFAKIRAQLPAAASMAWKELTTPVGFYHNRKAAAFLDIDYDPAVENMPANVVTGVIQAYNIGAGEHVLQTVRDCERPGPKRKIPVPQSQAPARQQLQQPQQRPSP